MTPADLRFCDGCMEGTSRSAEDNPYDSEVLCEVCFEAREWEHEHEPDECGEHPPGAVCMRDHEAEERQDWEDHQYHLMREGALV